MTLNSEITFISNTATRQLPDRALQNKRILFAGLIGAALLAVGFVNFTQSIKNQHDCKISQFPQKMQCLCGNNCSCGDCCGCH